MTAVPGAVLNQFGLKNLAGQKFGKLLVLEFSAKLPSGKYTWKCQCDCGNIVTTRHDYLLHTNCPKTHCGCANKGPSVLHPLEYGVWLMMLVRCKDPGHMAYHHYGGRGIKVCPEWDNGHLGFYQFLKDMGPRKSREWSIEREDVNGGYNPDNCTWLKKAKQGRNRRNTVRIPHPVSGLLVPAAEVAEFMKLSYQVMRSRMIAKGQWPTSPPSASPPARTNIDPASLETAEEDHEEDDVDASAT